MMAGDHITVLEALSDSKALHAEPLFARWRRHFQHWQKQGRHCTGCSWVAPPALRIGEEHLK
jgi:hypothetical protein